MVQDLTEDHRLWEQEMTWAPDLDFDSLRPPPMGVGRASGCVGTGTISVGGVPRSAPVVIQRDEGR